MLEPQISSGAPLPITVFFTRGHDLLDLWRPSPPPPPGAPVTAQPDALGPARRLRTLNLARRSIAFTPTFKDARISHSGWG